MPKSDFWDKLKSRLVEVTNAAADFTEEQAVVGKLKFDILNLNRKIDHNKHDIGARVLDISRSDVRGNPLDDSEVLKKIAVIGELEVQIEFKRNEISRAVEAIRGRRTHPKPEAAPASTGTKTATINVTKKPSKPAAAKKSTASTTMKAPTTKAAAKSENRK